MPEGAQCSDSTPEPTAEIDDAMQEKFEIIEPMITNIVRRTLPWLLSREVSQSHATMESQPEQRSLVGIVLATAASLWQTQLVKRRIPLTIAVIVFVAGIAAFFAFGTRRTQSVLPNPNGFDDFVAAAQWLVGWSGDFTAPTDEIRRAVGQNSKALETLRAGLGKQSAVPVQNDRNWLNGHMLQVGQHKSMAQLLVAEGLIHLREGRTNEAARSFADCIVFAHTAHRRGLVIDDLVGIACQAIGTKHLVQVAPHITSVTLEGILPDLMALDQAREPARAIRQRDRDWGLGAYGFLRSTWDRIAERKTLQAMEATFEKQHARSVASLRLVITDLAVRSYQARNGKPPTALAELVPAWLPAVPLDPFGNRPLIYRVSTNSFLLYSVGPDETDDQGTPLQRGKSEAGDLLPNTI